MKYRFERAGQIVDVDVEHTSQGLVLRGPDGVAQTFSVQTRPDGSQRVTTPWGDMEVTSARRGAELWLQTEGRRTSARVERARPSAESSGNAGGAGVLRAPMAGKLLRLSAQVGDEVRAGQAVAVIEAMKMENELLAPLDGVVVELGPSAPGTIDKGALILRLEPK